LWSRATVIVAARGLSDDLEISLLSERGDVAQLCEHCWLSVLMYTPGMSVMSLILKNRYDSKRSRDFVYGKRKMHLLFFSFLKKNFCPFGFFISKAAS
jgi:hypothetical protein